MDGNRFDDLGRALGGLGTRRDTLRVLIGSALAALAGNQAGDGAAKSKSKGKSKGKGKGKAKKKKKRQPNEVPCGATVCTGGQRCCGGSCVDPWLCCARTEDCNGCATCVGGVCVPDPTRNGQQCDGCLECANGACGIPNDDFCPQDHQCRGGNGVCCPTCVNGECCPAGSACINPGPFNANSCCDRVLNIPCGDRGDGTFRECCSGFNERCVDGECVPKEACEGDFTAQGLCCQNGQTACNGLCCETGRCTAVGCCPQPLKICGDDCCEEDETCCGGVCCRTSNCLNNSCCEDPCGDIGASTRVCPTAQETCCQTADDATGAGNRGFACPASAPRCGGVGTCCPADKFYSPSCNACCPQNDFQCQGCVPLTTGRT
jgi:hypothetical protein